MISLVLSSWLGELFCIGGRAVWQPLECQKIANRGARDGARVTSDPTGDLVSLCPAPGSDMEQGKSMAENTVCLIGGRPTLAKVCFRNLSLLSRVCTAFSLKVPQSAPSHRHAPVPVTTGITCHRHRTRPFPAATWRTIQSHRESIPLLRTLVHHQF
jgi:hypothetical protein